MARNGSMRSHAVGRREDRSGDRGGRLGTVEEEQERALVRLGRRAELRVVCFVGSSDGRVEHTEGLLGRANPNRP